MILRLAPFVALAATLAAQWPSNPATNFAVADRTGEQALPKIAATRDGGCYIGWFDHAGANYDVWLQRLDAAGVEQWPHNGVLVSSNPQNTSLVDWDLICDSDDDCVLTFTDTRAGGDLDVYAYRVDPSGAMLWGANGIALSNNADFEPNPRVCETSVGDFAFVWNNTVTRTTQLQRVTRAGVPLYAGDGLAIAADPGVTPGFARVCAAEFGNVIVEWVRATAFTAAKHIHMQKFDIAGNALWNGGTRLPVFDQASLPIAHDPKLIADGQGGCVISWHFALGNVFSARVQHVDASGVEVFAHNGVDLCTNANSKFDPSACWIAATQSIVALWNERNVGQTLWGISAQRIDASGAPMWGPTGTTLLPITNVELFAPVAVPYQGGAMGFVLETSLGPVARKVRALRVDQNGVAAWPVVDACTVASDKLRLQAAISPSGVAMLAWGDARSDSGNILTQNVDVLGQLGNHLGAATAYGCGINPANSLVASGRPAFGSTTTLRVDNPLATQSPGSLAFLVLGFVPAPGFPCGLTAPGFGMAAGGIGEILIAAGGTATSFGGVWLGAGQPVAFPIAIPAVPAFAGIALYTQGALFDTAPGATNTIGLTNGVRLTVGF